MIRTRLVKKLVFCTLSLGILLPWASAQIPGMAPPSTAQTSTPLGDNSALAREATGWLADLIKINTTNPPGNEEAAAKYIAAILQKEGITAELLPLAPGRSALVARLKNSAFSDPSKALLLVAHMDVVGVERAKWTVDPFGAVPKDGYIYGRGAVDDKGMLAANLAAFVALKRSNARLNRDVIFLATASEEGASDASIRMLISKYWDKVAAKYAINEGGNVFVKSGKVQYVAVQASEKVAVNVTVTANGKSGHASIPLKDNAVTHLCAAVEKIGDYNAPVHFTTIVRRYFEGIAPLQDDEIAKWIRSLDTAGPWRACGARDIRQQSDVECDASRYHFADHAQRRCARQRDSIGCHRDIERTAVAGKHYYRAARRAEQNRERSAGKAGSAAGRWPGGAGFFAGIGFLRRHRESVGGRICRGAGGAISIDLGHGFSAIALA